MRQGLRDLWGRNGREGGRSVGAEGLLWRSFLTSRGERGWGRDHEGECLGLENPMMMY